MDKTFGPCESMGMKAEAWKQYADAEILSRVRVRLIEPDEKAKWDALITERHYLGNAHLVGRQLRYVAELDEEWVALLGWNVAAYHLKAREEWIGWTVEQRLKRRKFIVQNSRYLLLVDRGQYPNLASRVLALCTRRLSEDWEASFGHSVVAVESFVDPRRFSGGCYRAAGWEMLGETRGYRRHHRDFYQEEGTPKELWIRALDPKARRWLSAERLPERLRRNEDDGQYCAFTVKQYRSLWERLNGLHDVRRAKGRRHRLASTLTICALATLSGARGTRAIADFASYLTQTQLRLLRCYRNPKTRRYEPPRETTIRRILKQVCAAEFDAAVTAWMAEHDSLPLKQLAVDGKTIKGSRHKDGRPVHLVGGVSVGSGRLVAQRPVDEKSNEITVLKPMLKDVPLDGVVVSADAMHAQQDAARFLMEEKGAEYFFTLKGNQPSIQEKAQRLLEGAFPPSASGAGRDGREAPRTSGNPADMGAWGDARTDALLRNGASGADSSAFRASEERPSER